MFLAILLTFVFTMMGVAIGTLIIVLKQAYEEHKEAEEKYDSLEKRYKALRRDYDQMRKEAKDLYLAMLKDQELQIIYYAEDEAE